jgi:SEC-C motif-containing protein
MSKKLHTPIVTPCPCGSGHDYARCCALFHEGQPAPTPEALMRSRYSAYALGLTPYLIATWAPETCPPDLDAHTPPQPKWLGLEVKEHSWEGERGEVRFTARGKTGGRAFRLEEVSRFERRQGCWVYVDGDVSE